MKRRDFLRGSASAATAITILPVMAWKAPATEIEKPDTVEYKDNSPVSYIKIDGRMIPYVMELNVSYEADVSMQDTLSGYRVMRSGQQQARISIECLESREILTLLHLMAAQTIHNVEIGRYMYGDNYIIYSLRAAIVNITGTSLHNSSGRAVHNIELLAVGEVMVNG